MKYVLLAASTLVATAGAAFADVSISGDGRMGLTYDSAATDSLAFTSRTRVSFTMSGQTDNGLTFGGSFRADNASGASSGKAGSAYIAGAYGRLSMGDVDGAAQAAVGHLHGAGLTGLGDLNEMVYLLGNSDPSALYEISAGYALFTVSADAYGGFGVGTRVTLGNYAVAIGYETLTDIAGVDGSILNGPYLLSDIDQVVVGASAAFDDVSVRGMYAFMRDSLGRTVNQYGVSVSYSADSLGLSAFWSGANNAFASSRYGVGASYDLGGGASIVGGVAHQRSSGGMTIAGNRTRADLGIAVNF
jgi:outer membrane protein OmpU